MNVDIIILSMTNNKELYQLTTNAVNSLKASENPTNIQFDITIIESNKAYNEKIYPYPGCNIIIPEEEFHYNRFCNIGLDNTHNEWVALCNNDLIFHPQWFSAILDVYNKNNNIRSFGTWNTINNWHGKYFPNHPDEIYGYTVSREITGWNIVFRREILEKIGKLPEHVNFWYSDNVYADAIYKAGISHCLVGNAIVDHIISASSKYVPHEQLAQMTQGQHIKYVTGLHK